MPSKSVGRYYAKELRQALRGLPRLLSFLLACVLHAAGHALLALVGGFVALSLTERLAVPTISDAFSRPLGNISPAEDKALFLSLLGLGIVFVKGASGAYATYVQARVAGEVGSRLRLELLDALLAVHRLHRPRHDDQGGHVGGTARRVAALTERVREVETGLEQGWIGGARAAAQLVPIAALLVALSSRMAIVAVAVLAVFGGLLARVRAGYRRASGLAARRREELLEAADEAVRHADLWVTYGAQSRARGLVARLGATLAAGAARLQLRAFLLSSANEVLAAAALVLAIAAARAGVLGRAPDGRSLFLFALAFFLAYRPLREIAEARLALARAQSAYEDLGRFIAAGASPAGTSRAREDDAGDAAAAGDAPARVWPLAPLELRSLRLAHGTSVPISLRIEPGSIAVLAGPTGIGKTTLLRTLLGLERAEGGKVLFGGESLEDAGAGPGERPFAWVPQDAPVVADTLVANVALASGANLGEVAEAIEALGAGHLTGALGSERLGAGGRGVSGGERQWIALARAIATRQPVLLLDEPTSGLDAASQERVLNAVARLRGKRTVVLVTHRPEPLSIADVVVRFDAQGAMERAA